MMDEKNGLPPYSAVAAAGGAWPRLRGRHSAPRRRRAFKLFALACLALIVLAQWKQIWRSDSRETRLSQAKLNQDLATCKKLRHKPKDPIGAGRDKNARYIDGAKPTLIKNATIWVGEPVAGTSEKDARAGKGWEWTTGDVLLEHGLIKRVEAHIHVGELPKETIVYDAAGRQLTSGIIDMHSHTGVYSLPSLNGNSDGNEMSDNITPWARSIDAIYPFDPQIQVIKSGGVTTSLILPGSGNNMGGEAYLVKHAVGRRDGRREISAADMLADPERTWRYMKMACGENAKNAHGGLGKRPFSRMGESYDFRHAFERARALIQRQDDWCDKAEAVGVENMDEYLPQEIFWESLGAALRGQVHINTHCYTVPDLEAMVDHTNEFQFPVRAFHHAHQTFLVPEILKRTWGGRTPSSAIFADNMYYKMEAYVGSEYAGKRLYDEGLRPIYVSDNPVINAQHVLFEAAKGYRYGLPYHAALAAVTSEPADDLGMGQRLGKVKPGFDADVVVWDSDPLSVGAAPVQVWIDGTAQFEDPVELPKPRDGPIVPDESLANIVEEPTPFADALFTGVTKVLLSTGDATHVSDGRPVNVVVTKGNITCIGDCAAEFSAATAAGVKPVVLKNGYLTHAFTGVAGTLGLNEIDAETATDNGDNPYKFTRAADGLQLGGKKLRAGVKYGVTRAISAPKFTGSQSHHGTSVGFKTSAGTSLEHGAVFVEDAAVHYTLDLGVRAVDSYSAAFGALRTKLMDAAKAARDATDPYSEFAYLRKVVKGEMVLALTINSADGIATALRIKAQVDKVLGADEGSEERQHIKMAIIGGAESHLVARELAAARVGVILLSLQATAATWDSRRALPGAPLTNGTTVDWLLDAGVTVGVGLPEDWQVRDLGLAAGTALRNGGGKLSEREALALVGGNIHKILGVEESVVGETGHFVVSEGSPLEIGGRIKAVGAGKGEVLVYVDSRS
ncbi:aldolase [Purpureocillium lavendulum]|uniref:Aldolase n=1 Tax=Purpureocillium lavendulum TaxID=1247861 RepID=A0AB34FRL7_9HYPO|nr:aldolase [Purpureocillium lavendulum]